MCRPYQTSTIILSSGQCGGDTWQGDSIVITFCWGWTENQEWNLTVHTKADDPTLTQVL